MKKKLTLLVLLFCSVITLGQEQYISNYTGDEIDSTIGHFIGDDFTRYVGGGEKNYPLTVEGLSAAIASLDSGLVIINYPGIEDTTGLGAISDKIAIYGWINGNYNMTMNTVLSSGYRKMVFGQTAARKWPSYVTNGLSPFYFYGRQYSYYPIFTVLNSLDGSSTYISKQAGSKYFAAENNVRMETDFQGTMPNQTMAQSNIIQLYGDNDTYPASSAVLWVSQDVYHHEIPYLPAALNYVIVNDNVTEWANNSDTVQCTSGIYQYWARVGTLGTGVYFYNTPYYMFNSKPDAGISARLLGTSKVYHFYGEGNFPSWFGGTVNSGAGYNFATDTSSTDDYKIVLAGAHTLTTGLEVTFKALHANTNNATLTVNALTAKALTKASAGAINTALTTGDILAGQIVKAVYDGTQFQVISRLAQ